MMHEFRRITIVKVRKPLSKQVNEDLQWFGSSLGLFSLRDKNSSCFRVFIELLKAAKLNRPMSSDELALRLGLSRGTVIFHLDKLIAAGLVAIHNGRYMLKESNLEHLIEELRQDAERVFASLKQIAKEIDIQIGFERH
jgi:predicted transcriptional regulator